MKELMKNSNTTTYSTDTVYANAYEVFSCRSYTVGKVNYQTSTFKLWEPEDIEMMFEEAGNAHVGAFKILCQLKKLNIEHGV